MGDGEPSERAETDEADETDAVAPTRVVPRGGRLGRIPLLLAGLGVALALSRHWPKDQTLRVVLGDAAPDVTEVRLRYGEAGARRTSEPEREVTFRYAKGRAPRIVSHEPRLADGDYDVDIEVGVQRGDRGGGEGDARSPVALVRRVSFASSAVSVDVSRDVREGGR